MIGLGSPGRARHVKTKILWMGTTFLLLLALAILMILLCTRSFNPADEAAMIQNCLYGNKIQLFFSPSHYVMSFFAPLFQGGLFWGRFSFCVLLALLAWFVCRTFTCGESSVGEIVMTFALCIPFFLHYIPAYAMPGYNYLTLCGLLFLCWGCAAITDNKIQFGTKMAWIAGLALIGFGKPPVFVAAFVLLLIFRFRHKDWSSPWIVLAGVLLFATFVVAYQGGLERALEGLFAGFQDYAATEAANQASSRLRQDHGSQFIRFFGNLLLDRGFLLLPEAIMLRYSARSSKLHQTGLAIIGLAGILFYYDILSYDGNHSQITRTWFRLFFILGGISLLLRRGPSLPELFCIFLPFLGALYTHTSIVATSSYFLGIACLGMVHWVQRAVPAWGVTFSVFLALSALLQLAVCFVSPQGQSSLFETRILVKNLEGREVPLVKKDAEAWQNFLACNAKGTPMKHFLGVPADGSNGVLFLLGLEPYQSPFWFLEDLNFRLAKNTADRKKLIAIATETETVKKLEKDLSNNSSVEKTYLTMFGKNYKIFKTVDDP